MFSLTVGILLLFRPVYDFFELFVFFTLVVRVMFGCMAVDTGGFRLCGFDFAPGGDVSGGWAVTDLATDVSEVFGAFFGNKTAFVANSDNMTADTFGIIL